MSCRLRLFSPCILRNTRRSCLPCARNMANGKLGQCRVHGCRWVFVVGHTRRHIRRVLDLFRRVLLTHGERSKSDSGVRLSPPVSWGSITFRNQDASSHWSYQRAGTLRLPAAHGARSRCAILSGLPVVASSASTPWSRRRYGWPIWEELHAVLVV